MIVVFIFVFQQVVSPLVALLVIGYGTTGSIGSHQALLAAISKLQARLACERNALERICDPAAIDFWLARQGRLFAIESIEAIALSINSQTVTAAGGGVIGSPFAELLPAPSQLEFLTQDICIVAFPGGPGVALMGINQEQGEIFITKLNQLTKGAREPSQILNLAETTPATAAVVILDGCGGQQTGGGGFFIRQSQTKKTYRVPGGSMSGACSLELYHQTFTVRSN